MHKALIHVETWNAHHWEPCDVRFSHFVSSSAHNVRKSDQSGKTDMDMKF
jgi:hypothetical protein